MVGRSNKNIYLLLRDYCMPGTALSALCILSHSILKSISGDIIMLVL